MKKILGLLLAMLPLAANAAYDVTGDGEINVGDVSALYEVILNPSAAESGNMYDVNGDGVVNAGDVSELYAVLTSGASVADLYAADDSGTGNYIFDNIYDTRFSWKIYNGDPVKTYRLKVYLSGREDGNTLAYRLPADREYLHFTGSQMQAIVTQLLGYNQLEGETRVMFRIVDGSTAISNEVSFGLKDFVKKVPKLWYLTGNSIGGKPWNVAAIAPAGGLVPMYPLNNTMQRYVGWFPENAAFKLISTPGSWAEALGYSDLGYADGRTVTCGDEDDSQIKILKAGLYEVSVYTNDKTVTVQPYFGGDEKLFGTISIAGDIDGWNPQTEGYAMTRLNSIATDGSYYYKNTEHNHDWRYSVSHYGDHELKFVGDNNWEYNWGAATFPYGVGVTNGDNIPVKSGDYDIYFNDITGQYLFVNKAETPGLDVAIDFNAPDSEYYVTDRYGNGGPDYEYSSPLVDCNDGVLDFTLAAYGQDACFKIVPQSAYRYGHDADEERFSCGSASVDADGVYSGTVVRGGKSDMSDAFYAKFVPGTSSYAVHIDLNTMTYTITPPKGETREFVYLIGSESGWQTVFPLRSVAKDNVFKGYGYISEAFKFRSGEDNWDSPLWGDNSSISGPGAIVDGGDDISCYVNGVDEGFYEVTVDLNTMRWTVGDAINTIGLTGTAVGGWDKDYYTLHYNADEGAWVGEVTFTAGSFKFRANGEWDLYWGGSLELPEEDGDDIVISASQAGSYLVRFYLRCDGMSRCELEKI